MQFSYPTRGAWWLSGRVLDWRLKGHWLETHLHCIVSLSMTLYPLFSNNGSTQEDLLTVT